MKHTRWLLVGGLLLVAASIRAAANAPAGELALGALSYLVSHSCGDSHGAGDRSVEFPGLVYAAGRQPAWGTRSFGPCRGLNTWMLQESVAAGAYWGQADHAAIEADPNHTLFDNDKIHAAFKDTFGWEVPQRGDYMPQADVFLRFDAKKLSALFDRFYPKPTDKVGPLTAQEAYDVFLRDFVTRLARDAAFIKANVPKAKLAKLLKDYQAAAKKDGTSFKGPAYLNQVVASALPRGEQGEKAGRALGIVLRRTADGTWPTVTRLLKKVLAEYDPTLSKELAAKL